MSSGADSSGSAVVESGSKANEATVPCPAMYIPALEIRITDAATGAPLVNGTTAVATEGTYTETLRPDVFTVGEDGSWIYLVVTGVNRAGTYAVQITHPGYEPLILNDVVVTKGVCGFYADKISVAMKPLASQ